MDRIKFVKMHASGNDFIVVDNRMGEIRGDAGEFVRRVCRPHFSVGADGLILVEDSDRADFRWRFFNSDGGEVEMCGNGSRCVALFAYKRGIAGRELSFETLAGTIRAEIMDGSVKVQLTAPSDLRPKLEIDMGRGPREASFINTGVPHVVYFVEDLDGADVKGVGAATRYHEMFRPGGTNANFARVDGESSLSVRTYERGVEDETFACGTGVTAAALVAGARGLVRPPVEVSTRGGDRLKVYFNWDGAEFTDVFLEGGAVFVYSGELEDGALL